MQCCDLICIASLVSAKTLTVTLITAKSVPPFVLSSAEQGAAMPRLFSSLCIMLRATLIRVFDTARTYTAVVTNEVVQVVDKYSSNSFRLLAGAVGVIQNVQKLDLLHMTQQQVEACATEMQLLSLVVLTNSVRDDSRETIRQLQDG